MYFICIFFYFQPVDLVWVMHVCMFGFYERFHAYHFYQRIIPSFHFQIVFKTRRKFYKFFKPLFVSLNTCFSNLYLTSLDTDKKDNSIELKNKSYRSLAGGYLYTLHLLCCILYDRRKMRISSIIEEARRINR